ncbi:hypothetical protein I4U23_002603 [Adineta vaga]|nr:hypothetical protein I4U23_002603 [Adineta vaga]
MYYKNAFTSFHVNTTVIIVFSIVQTASAQSWSNHIRDLSPKTYISHSDNNSIDQYPVNEEFMLLRDKHKNHPLTKFKSYNTSSTTCTTVTKTKSITNISSPVINHSIGHLGRRLLNEPSYDTDLDISSPQALLQDDNEIGDFLQVNEEDMHKAFVTFEITTDGSGETTDYTTEYSTDTSSTITVSFITTDKSTALTTFQTSSGAITTTVKVPENIVLSNITTFEINVNCIDPNTTLINIITQFNVYFYYTYNVSYQISNTPNCPKSSTAKATLTFYTSNNTTILNDLYRILKNITGYMNIDLYSINLCGYNIEPILVTNVTSCFLIDQCSLCGRNKSRGTCDPKQNLSKCRCYINDDDPTRPYEGDLCAEPGPTTIKPTASISRWIPIVVGILAGLTALFCIITSYLLIMAISHRRHRSRERVIHSSAQKQFNGSWYLPRARIPTSVTAENVYNYLQNDVSTSSIHRTNSNHTEFNSMDDKFLQRLDQQINPQSNTTTSESMHSIRAYNIESDTISSLHSYDPIYELDAIIDSGNLHMDFHDSSNELYRNIREHEVIYSYL